MDKEELTSINNSYTHKCMACGMDKVKTYSVAVELAYLNADGHKIHQEFTYKVCSECYSKYGGLYGKTYDITNEKTFFSKSVGVQLLYLNQKKVE